MPQIYTASTPAARRAVASRPYQPAPAAVSEAQLRRHEAWTRDAKPSDRAVVGQVPAAPAPVPPPPAHTREVLLNATAHSLTRPQVVALMEENLTLKEALRQMQEDLAPQALIPTEWRLTGRERDVLLTLRKASPNVVHRERMLIALYGVLEADMPDQKILDVWICKLRRKLMLAQTQVSIETVWGRGWRLDSENFMRLEAHIQRASEPTWMAGAPLLIAAE